MNREKSPLQKLPRASSPETLDERIVSEARRLAPAKQSRLFPRWVPALATVSLIAVAVVVVRPVFQSLQIEHAVMETVKPSLQEEVVGNNTGKAERSTMIMSDEPVSTAPQPTGVQSLGAGNTQVRQPASVVTEEAITEGEAAPVLKKQVLPGDDETDSATDHSQLIQSESNRAVDEVVAPESGLTDDEYRHLVNKILELLEAGKIGEARRMLEQLRSLCPQCDLPDEPEQLTLPE